MTPDTAALRALADAITPGLCATCGHPEARHDGDPDDRTCWHPDEWRGAFCDCSAYIAALDPDTVRALCDAADEVERLRAEVSLARRIIDLDMRLHAPSASTAGCGGGIGGQMMTPHCPDYCEHPKHDADKALREDLLRDFYRLARTPLPERDASRTAHAALVAGIETGLRESACAECDHDRCATYRSAASWVRDYAALDHHAPTTGATP